jgi:hypothetical protein
MPTRQMSNPLYKPQIGSEQRNTDSARTPFELLLHRGTAGTPLAALTIQTVYATLSKYTSCVQTFKRDPLALARRVIANAWRSHWSLFGKLSWWVLGLFVSSRVSKSGQKSWDWDTYDGESIAQHCCTSQAGESPVDIKSRSTEASHEACRVDRSTATSTSAKEGALPTPSPEPPRAGWGQSLLLWGKFSAAIFLAVGGAIIKGPAEMMREAEEKRRSRSSSLVEASETRDLAQRIHPRCPDLRQEASCDKPRDQHDNPARFQAAQATARKPRSSSSPPTSPAFHGQIADVAFLYTVDKEQIVPRQEEAMADMWQEQIDQSNDETLKPSRSPRKGIISIFDASGDAVLALCGSSVKPPFLNCEEGPGDQSHGTHARDDG